MPSRRFSSPIRLRIRVRIRVRVTLRVRVRVRQECLPDPFFKSLKHSVRLRSYSLSK